MGNWNSEKPGRKKQALVIASVASMHDNFNRNNISLLIESGFEVTLAANFRTDEDINSREKIDAFVREMKKKDIQTVQIDFTRKLTKIRQQIMSARQVRKLLSRRFDLVHCHSPICAAITRFLYEKYRKSYGGKMIYTAHGFHFYKGAPLKNWILYYPPELLLSRRTDVLVTINHEDYQRARKHFHAKNTYFIPGVGVDTEKFSDSMADVEKKRAGLGVSETDIMLISVGELSRRKNHETVIRALAQYAASNIRYFICGQGELEGFLKVLIHELGLEDQVKLLGFRTDITELLQAADLFIFPSRQEGLPVALMEAMACGTPVICSKIRGNEDLVRDPSCMFENVDDLCRCFERLLGNGRDGLAACMKDAAQANGRRIKKMALPVIEKKMRLIYKKEGGGTGTGAVPADMPLVSVIVSAYNVQDYIESCMDSLLNQTYPYFEIIVCDDGSTDHTAEILQKYKKDPRIRLLQNHRNRKQAVTRNRCIRVGRGEYVMIQDADDLAEPDRIEKLLGAFEDGIDFVGSGSYLFDENGIFEVLYGSREYPDVKDLLWRLPFVHASVMFRRECLEAAGGYRSAGFTVRVEDYDLFMRLYEKGYRGKNIKDLLYGYRVDRAAYARRTFQARLNECAVRYDGFKRNHVLLPFGWIFIGKPLLAHALQAVKNRCRKHYFEINGLCAAEHAVRKSRVVLSFDDGRADNYRLARDVLLKKKIPAVFNITTGYIDRTIPAEHAPCKNPGMSVEDILQLKQWGFEIAGHGDRHENTAADIRRGIAKLHLWLDGGCRTDVGFASPHSGMDESGTAVLKPVLDQIGISYVRTGVRDPKALLLRCIRKAAQLAKSVRLYQAGFRNSLERVGSRYVSHSIPVMHKTTLQQVQGIIRLAVLEKKDCVLMFHSILKKGEMYYEDTWSWDYDDFAALCDWLVTMRQKEKLKTVSAMEAFKG